MRFAAADDRVFTTDAQAIAQRLLGDTMPSNIVMLGAAFQRGLVPVSESALLRAIELNGVAIETNRLAFGLGRLSVAAPQALRRLAGDAPAPGAAGLFDAGGLVERREAFLTAYQDAALARRYRALVDRVAAREREVAGNSATALTEAVARCHAKLLAIKDEYEVARLYADGEFLESLGRQFQRWERIEFHMAPPLLARRGPDGRPRKMTLGPWLMPAMKLLAPLRRWRGSWIDVFGHTAERRMERQLARDYESIVADLLAGLTQANLPLAVAIASVPDRIRGYGHVKLASVTTARARWQELLDRYHGRVTGKPAAGAVIPIAEQRPRDVVR
jgi:indolepyruvate ferredoxin oxidoreductase